MFKLGVRDSQTWPTKAQAVAWATQREAEILAEKGARRTSDFTVMEALKKYKAEVSPKKAGQRWEEIRIDRFIAQLPFVGEKVNDIEADHISAWRDERLKEVSDPSVRREMTLLSSVFEWARREWRWISVNPVKQVQRPSNNRPRDRRISDAEIALIVDGLGYVEGQPPVTQMQEVAYAFLIAIETAMRQGEILGLTKRATRLRERYARLAMTKNGDARDVPLSRRAVDLLQVMVDAAGDREKLFSVSSASADALFRKVRDRLEIEGLRFHDTRHEATTRLARKLDVLDLARMTGHRDPRSLMVYYNATASEVASRLD
ncbi:MULTISPECIES: site-specific integrase [unclassified Pseudomonas]|uniref:tyrosine-type recombinase/integrase n=1 Tax=unclassified Pseudomonas TaxID=196821 RepID=UPI0024493182|nr:MULTISPECIES: site-specific integrase [unclassified Pseudomonas]MDG9928305.1 site-specific integrase [Pseudomonas sp. GD04042]MDH0481131.1 site-specific integrase [Pseudomonas sp. GD04015]MDH0604467.1 site-specific integrase [Pseudomonas sp. GD03869]